MYKEAGDIYVNREEWKLAADCYSKDKNTYKKAGDIYFLKCNELELAASCYSKIESMCEEAGDIYLKCNKLKLAADCYFKAKKWEKAGNNFEKVKGYTEAVNAYPKQIDIIHAALPKHDVLNSSKEFFFFNFF